MNLEISSDELLWDQLKAHIQPAEVDSYARKIGLARISRNEDAFNERATLLQMQNSIHSDIAEEIEKKNPPLLNSYQRQRAINRAVSFLDSLRQMGHFVDPDNATDSQMLKYLKYTKTSRPNSQQSSKQKSCPEPLSARKQLDPNESITEVQSLIDDEYNRIQNDINAIRISLFSSCDELEDVKELVPPSTDSIEQFNKKLQTKEVVVRQMNNTARTSSSINRLRDSIHANRLWD
ncbi:hypothetical protein M9Y10_004466 [Tritrichomonas musculus]|uniref:Uncharacterized protein n=1 Tax=Tritrichomonas musculus TaxID=1915356 RepID=A0ABR2JTE5_9EUKA